MVAERSDAGNLDVWFKALVVDAQKCKMGGKGVGALTEWKDLPMELLLRIVSLLDDRTVIVASCVCTGWKQAISLGLTHLSLSWCKDHMNNLVLSISPRFIKLQSLTLRQNKAQLEDNAVEAIASYCCEMRCLDLSRSHKLTDRSLHALANGCPHLSNLNISGCSGFSDSALVYLSSFCRKLNKLNLCGCARAVSDKALEAISHNCNHLQFLNLGWCDYVSDRGVTCLATGCPDLRTIDLCGCILITDETVIALANGCPRLRSLGLYYCQNITDRSMYSLANSHAKSGHEHGCWSSLRRDGLTSLNVSQCTALTPPAVQAVCDSFPGLHTCPDRHSLIISGCLSLTTVHCKCTVQARRARTSQISHHAY